MTDSDSLIESLQQAVEIAQGKREGRRTMVDLKSGRQFGVIEGGKKRKPTLTEIFDDE